jgi:hypothetical protein
MAGLSGYVHNDRGETSKIVKELRLVQVTVRSFGKQELQRGRQLAKRRVCEARQRLSDSGNLGLEHDDGKNARHDIRHQLPQAHS